MPDEKQRDDIVELKENQAGAVTEEPSASVFILTSPTYVREEDAPFDDVIVGVFVTRLAAETYKADATPPVDDGKIVKWGVQGGDVAPAGRIAPFHGLS